MPPTPQPADDPASWYDDPEIGPSDRLLRLAKTHFHIIQIEGGGFGLSPQLWTSYQGGCSVELESLYQAAAQTVDDRVRAGRGFGAAEILVQDVRAIFNRYDAKNKVGYEPLCVAYTPISEEEEFGPNPFHADIFPKLGNPGKNLLHSKKQVVRLDQDAASILWDEKLSSAGR